MKVNIDDIKKAIASEIKTMNLQDVLDSSVVNVIAMRIKNEADFNRTVSEAPKGVLPESEFPIPTNFNNNSFPEESDILSNNPNTIEQPEENDIATVDVQPEIPSGSFPTDVAYSPEVSNKPIIPYEIQNKEPVKLFVFQESELVQNGEVLAAKEFATVDDPNTKKSMTSIWVDQVNLKAEMYLVKFEKIGDMTYDFTSNSAILNREQNSVPQNNVPINTETPYMGVEVADKQTDIETIALNAAKQAIQNYQTTNIQTMQEEISKADSNFIEEQYTKVELPTVLKEHINWGEGQVYSNEKEVKMLTKNKDNKFTAYLVGEKDVYVIDHKTEACYKKG